MREEEILTLQSAVELDRIHNEGKLFKALQAGHITKEEMISSIFTLVQRKNAQNETQKMLSQIHSTSGGIVGDFWEKEQPSLKNKIISKILYDRNGEFNIQNLKKISVTLLGISFVGYLFAKNGFRNIANYRKKKAIRKEEEIKRRKVQRINQIKMQYQKQVEQLNQILENADLTEEKRKYYMEMKEEIENILNNNDNSVGDIVENK